MQEEGRRGSRVIYSALNRCRVKFLVEPQNKALSPSLEEKKGKLVRKRVFAHAELPLPQRDQESLPGGAGKDNNFQRGYFQKKPHLYPEIPGDL